jgi:DNA topoisomerase-1
MVLKHGRYGNFLACSNYPECKNIKPYFERTAQICPKCGRQLVKRIFRGGRALYTCENSDCDFSSWDEPLEKTCNACGSTMFAHKFKGRVPMLYCGNENCTTRAGHPINKILEDAKKRREAKKK